MNWYRKSKSKKKKKPQDMTQLDIINQQRGIMPPPTKWHSEPKGKKVYDRKDKSWHSWQKDI